MRDQIQQCIEKRIEALEKGYRQNIGVIGPEGYGKTHLLSSLFAFLAGQPKLIPIYIDANTLDYEHLADRWIGAMLTGLFVCQAVRPPESLPSLLQAAATVVPKTSEKIKHFKKMMRREKNAASVRELFSLTGALAEETGKRIVLMIDEFQALADLPASDPFALFGKEIMVEKNTLYLVTSSQPVRAREIFRDKLSLLFSNFEVVEMRPFSFEETAEFVTARFPGRVFTAAQKRFMIRLTNGNPVYLELLLDQLESLLSIPQRGDLEVPTDGGAEKIATATLFAAAESELLNSKGRIFQIFEKRLTLCRRFAKDSASYLRTLLAISHGRRKLLPISAYIEKKTQETKKILQRLIQEGIIAKHGVFYALEDSLFRFWLREVETRRCQLFAPDFTPIASKIREALRHKFQKSENDANMDVAARVEALFKEFRNDVTEFDGKKITCQQFSEIICRPSAGRSHVIAARQGDIRWLCLVACDKVKEDDLTGFLEEIKKTRKKVQKRILITLDGIEQNAKLMAQEAKVQLWDLRSLNALLDLYDLPKMILLPEQEEDGTTLGALAQSVHTA